MSSTGKPVLKNSNTVDRIRRSILKRLPTGAVEKIWKRLGVTDDRVYDEHEDRRVYSLDITIAGLDQLGRHDRRDVLDNLLRRWDLRTLELERRDLDDSAVA